VFSSMTARAIHLDPERARSEEALREVLVQPELLSEPKFKPNMFERGAQTALLTDKVSSISCRNALPASNIELLN